MKKETHILMELVASVALSVAPSSVGPVSADSQVVVVVETLPLFTATQQKKMLWESLSADNFLTITYYNQE